MGNVLENQLAPAANNAILETTADIMHPVEVSDTEDIDQVVQRAVEAATKDLKEQILKLSKTKEPVSTADSYQELENKLAKANDRIDSLEQVILAITGSDNIMDKPTFNMSNIKTTLEESRILTPELQVKAPLFEDAEVANLLRDLKAYKDASPDKAPLAKLIVTSFVDNEMQNRLASLKLKAEEEARKMLDGMMDNMRTQTENLAKNASKASKDHKKKVDQQVKASLEKLQKFSAEELLSISNEALTKLEQQVKNIASVAKTAIILHRDLEHDRLLSHLTNCDSKYTALITPKTKKKSASGKKKSNDAV